MFKKFLDLFKRKRFFLVGVKVSNEKGSLESVVGQAMFGGADLNQIIVQYNNFLRQNKVVVPINSIIITNIMEVGQDTYTSFFTKREDPPIPEELQQKQPVAETNQSVGNPIP